MGGDAEVQDCISKLHKAALGLLEAADGGTAHSGVAVAAGALRHRFLKEDTSVLKGLRALSEAYRFVRRITRCGEAAWLASLDRALGRLQPSGDAVDGDWEDKTKKGKGKGVVTAMEVVDGVPAVKGFSQSAKRRAARNRSDAMHVEGANLPSAPTPARAPTVQPAAAQSVQAAALTNELNDEWADTVLRAGAYARRMLKHQSSRACPPLRKLGRGFTLRSAAVAASLFTVGQAVLAHGVVGQAVYNGQVASVVSFDTASERVCVRFQQADVAL